MTRFLSVCSGIEAASVAWEPLGWEPLAFAEIDPFPSALLKHRFPTVPNWGDMTRFEEWPDADVDILVGGTPCQDYSVAGLRLGMAGDRGQLTLTFVEIAARYRPRVVVWENVLGVLSSNGGRDFARFLGDLCGQTIPVPEGGWQNSGIIPGIPDAYGLAYRTLDAQYVRVDGLERAVPQRRRRVFVVGHLGDWRRAAAVLFERESLSGHPAPRREAGQGVAGATGERVAFGGNNTSGPIDVATACQAHGGPHGRQDFASETFIAAAAPCLDASFGRLQGHDNQHIDGGAGHFIAFSAKDHGADAMVNLSPTLRAGGFDKSHANAGVMPAIAFDTTQITSAANYSNPKPGDPCHPLAAGAHVPAIAFDAYNQTVSDVAHPLRVGFGNGSGDEIPQTLQGWAVRRLTPVECERLQGFPDGWTEIPYRGKPAADGPRYKALGNSMAVNVMRWIGRRIEMVDAAEAALPIAAE
jgi:DNA (cytosine-5)-methyltransferase 1